MELGQWKEGLKNSTLSLSMAKECCTPDHPELPACLSHSIDIARFALSLFRFLLSRLLLGDNEEGRGSVAVFPERLGVDQVESLLVRSFLRACTL